MSPTCERSSLRPENPETPKSSASVLKNMVTYPPPTHAFLKQPFLTDFKKHTHTPPKVTTFWCIGLKVEKSREKCEFAPCWHKLNVPERYADTLRGIPTQAGRGGSSQARGPTRNSHYPQLPPIPTTPNGTHATRGNGHTIHTPRTQGVGEGVHDALATRRTERGNGQAEGCYVPRSGN